MGYAIWCQGYGCLGRYDLNKADSVGMLAETREADKKDPPMCTFPLRKGMKRQETGKARGHQATFLRNRHAARRKMATV